MQPQVGQTYQLSADVPTGIAPGGSQYKAPTGSQLKVVETRNVGGQTYYNIDQRAFGGGTGWASAQALQAAIGGAPAPAPAAAAPATVPAPSNNNNPTSLSSAFAQAQPTINLQDVYDKALSTAGVSNYQAEADNVQKQIDERRQALATETSKINDNPFYSEATRVGRIAKLNAAAEQDIGNFNTQATNAQNKVSAAKADAQVRLNIAKEQYNIQDAQYQKNLNMFNTMLTSGALNSASSSDIGQIAVSTGLSTSMIQSIVDASKAKEAEAHKPQLMTIDDGVNQKVVAVDSSGNIINSQIIGNSKPTKPTAASTNEANLAAGNFTSSQVSKAIKILAKADTMSNANDHGDKLLSAYEQQQALLAIQAQISPDPNVAYQLLQKAAEQGGFGDWVPKK